MGVLDVAEPVERLWFHSEVAHRLLLLAPQGAHAVGQLNHGVGLEEKESAFGTYFKPSLALAI